MGAPPASGISGSVDLGAPASFNESLMYNTFGPPSTQTWTNAAGAVNVAGGAEMAGLAIGMGPAFALDGSPEILDVIPYVLRPLERKAVDGVLKQIANGAKGKRYFNADGKLPQKADPNYYREYTAQLPGSTSKGGSRVVVGDGGEVYYSPNHYGKFVRVK